MAVGHPQALNSIVLEIKLDQHGRLVSHHPAIMPRFDDNSLGSGELQDAAVRIFNMDLPGGEEADVGMHASFGTGNRLHVSRPAKADRIDLALDAGGPGACDVELNAADFAVLGTLHGCE